MIDAVLNWDRTAFWALNSAAWTGSFWDIFWYIWTVLGYGAPLTLLGFLGLFFLDRKHFPNNFIYFALAVLCGAAVSQSLKSAIARPRPISDHALYLHLDESATKIKAGFLSVMEIPSYKNVAEKRRPINRLRVIGIPLSRRSFPSGHAQSSFSVALCLAYVYRRKRHLLWLIPAALISFSRIAVGAHFPIDVLAGALIGAFSSWGFLALTRKYHGFGLPLHPAQISRKAGEALRVMIVAGESSADNYGANLLKKLKEIEPDLEASGMGGEAISGLPWFRKIADASELSIIGFTAVLAGLFRIRRIFLALLHYLETNRPHVLICIDLPDFNLALARQAHHFGAKVVYYISPQIWIWRRYRVRTVKERVDLMVCAFPFEPDFYHKAGVNAEFYGHPILELLGPLPTDRKRLRESFGLPTDGPVFLAAPGSRSSEIKYLLKPISESMSLCSEEIKKLTVAVPLAPRVNEQKVMQAFLSKGIKAVPVKGGLYELAAACDFGVVTSGTATLEAALAGMPMVIVYAEHPINVFIAKKMMASLIFGLPNIILGKQIFPELAQNDASGEMIAKKILSCFGDKKTYEQLVSACARIRQIVSADDANITVSRQVAEAVRRIAGQNKEVL